MTTQPGGRAYEVIETDRETATRIGGYAVLTERAWLDRRRAHEERVERLLRPYLEDRARGRAHPVRDFLFTYYSYRPARLRHWHPGAGTFLTGPHAREYARQPGYRTFGPDDRGRLAAREGAREGIEPSTEPGAGPSGGAGTARSSGPDTGPAAGPSTGPGADPAGELAVGPAVGVDPAALAARRTRIGWIRDLLDATLRRPAHFGCLGLHEWAMVYRATPEQIRHAAVPLRLGRTGTNDVVEAHRIRCSHADAFRFFTPQAEPRNSLQPTRDTQLALEQGGCLHTNMDLYKWAYKLAPFVPSELIADGFELAGRIRELDMRASPYDLTEFGYEPVRIETPEGKAAYAREQRAFAATARELRRRLRDTCDVLLALADRAAPRANP